MKRILLGSLLSCMLVGQAFCGDNLPIVGDGNQQPVRPRALSAAVTGALLGVAAMGLACSYYMNQDIVAMHNDYLGKIKQHNAAIDAMRAAGCNGLDSSAARAFLRQSFEWGFPVARINEERASAVYLAEFSLGHVVMPLMMLGVSATSVALAGSVEPLNPSAFRRNVSDFCKGLSPAYSWKCRYNVGLMANAGYKACKSYFGY